MSSSSSDGTVAIRQTARAQPKPALGAVIVRNLRRREVIASLIFLPAFLALWEWGPALGGLPTYILPPLSEVIAEFPRAFETERLLFHTGITGLEVAIGFPAGVLLGMVIGFSLGMSPTAEFVLSPYILALQIAPKVAFAALFVIWFGYTLTPRILVAVLIVFFPVMINVLGAVRAVDPAMVDLARSFDAKRSQIFWKIEFPASLPSLFSGMRIGSTLAVIGVVVGEFVGGNVGLGVVLSAAEGQANTPLVFVSIIMMTLVGAIAYYAVVILERRVLHYMPRREMGKVEL